MLPSFTGEYPQKVDGKGRMSIPADFRGVLESRDPKWTSGLAPRLVLQYADTLKDHLRVYAIDEIERIRAGIERLPSGINKRGLAHLYMAQTVTMEVDKDGRIVLPIRLRQKLGLEEGEVTFLGYGSYFEIWRTETFSGTKAMEIGNWIEAMDPDFDPLSLIDALPEG
ncbi:cell division protein MraZ [Flavimaricola marinus]|uniref:Transcriptional regulator MraZ n=2 Tax=Flavimaricola marinus TaxID=1819565 RepID=A0A238LE82_9RHOB|nr:cell division protein MraZ [Flavimaricola marinus]